ncbi:hypothetical protein GQ53DRAFT_289987 [Thozetella sp. PMI_491]|nr:hypothetical protein GQ53DRAFT_289987 [Thozetella sp. PMI_491]
MRALPDPEATVTTRPNARSKRWRRQRRLYELEFTALAASNVGEGRPEETCVESAGSRTESQGETRSAGKPPCRKPLFGVLGSGLQWITVRLAKAYFPLLVTTCKPPTPFLVYHEVEWLGAYIYVSTLVFLLGDAQLISHACNTPLSPPAKSSESSGPYAAEPIGKGGVGVSSGVRGAAHYTRWSIYVC